MTMSAIKSACQTQPWPSRPNSRPPAGLKSVEPPNTAACPIISPPRDIPGLVDYLAALISAPDVVLLYAWHP
jgi:hypothetical protein